MGKTIGRRETEEEFTISVCYSGGLQYSVFSSFTFLFFFFGLVLSVVGCAVMDGAIFLWD